eukprot:TRINITY_DN28417_c0_g1_i1.p1 TRINITY_DN28417_c0_g1~~TRINITY_DN28417_c0_g1_i1.p1  ORF type:complete len:238 (-),score=22.04 TRINITY_DN28417_c0_g1_i1:40-753(-)
MNQHWMGGVRQAVLKASNQKRQAKQHKFFQKAKAQRLSSTLSARMNISNAYAQPNQVTRDLSGPAHAARGISLDIISLTATMPEVPCLNIGNAPFHEMNDFTDRPLSQFNSASPVYPLEEDSDSPITFLDEGIDRTVEQYSSNIGNKRHIHSTDEDPAHQSRLIGRRNVPLCSMDIMMTGPEQIIPLDHIKSQIVPAKDGPHHNITPLEARLLQLDYTETLDNDLMDRPFPIAWGPL